jgi:hypothetical protein
MVPACAGGLLLNPMSCGVFGDEVADIACLCRDARAAEQCCVSSGGQSIELCYLTAWPNGNCRTVNDTLNKQLRTSRTMILGRKVTRS